MTMVAGRQPPTSPPQFNTTVPMSPPTSTTPRGPKLHPYHHHNRTLRTYQNDNAATSDDHEDDNHDHGHSKGSGCCGTDDDGDDNGAVAGGIGGGDGDSSRDSEHGDGDGDGDGDVGSGDVDVDGDNGDQVATVVMRAQARTVGTQTGTTLLLQTKPIKIFLDFADAEAPKKPAKRVKVGGLEGTHPPRLELSDDEVKPMSAGSVPPNSVRKLRRLETLIQDRDKDRNSSLDNNLSHFSATGSEGLDSEPVEGDSEEHEDMVAFTQTPRSSQRLAVKRPSWLGGATEDAAEIGVPCLNAPDDTLLSVPSNYGMLPSDVRTGAQVHSEPPTGKRVRFKGLDNQDSEYAGMASKGTDVHSKCPQDAILGLTGINVDTVSEGQQATRVHSECRSKGQQLAQTHFQHHSEGRQMELTHSKCRQVIATGLKGTASEGRQVIFSYPTGYPQAASSEFAATTPEDSTRNGNTGEVPQLWPMDTDLSKTSVKLRLTDQSSIVRSTITGSFSLLHASIVLENAFPETLQVARFIWDALVVASLQVWGAEDVHARILKDSNYCWQMSVLPQAHISIFHAEVKEHCVVTVALLFSLYDPIAIVDLVKKLETDFSYIYPRRSKANNDHVLVGSPDLRHPFCSSVIISVLHDLYFSGNTPFVTLHQDQFLCRHGPNEDIIWEVPKAMLTLVSTVYYAALHEWSTGERRQLDFTTNTFVEVYECHIANLNWIETECNTSYHKMMADIYQLATNGGLNQPPPSNSVPVLDLSMMED
ncbi:hypothetical protein EDB86DRAFT_2838744 [Lactarius hatsudake]|nr:hypothetical protein EDB86DRAFT_2838744 [Lactarius hatsudake]